MALEGLFSALEEHRVGPRQNPLGELGKFPLVLGAACLCGGKFQLRIARHGVERLFALAQPGDFALRPVALGQ